MQKWGYELFSIFEFKNVIMKSEFSFYFLKRLIYSYAVFRSVITVEYEVRKILAINEILDL